MKDLVQIWNRVANRRYSNNVTERELKELSNNRLKISDIDKANFEANLAECEGLNSKFEEIDFSDGKDAIINRLFEQRKKGQIARQPKCLFILLMLGFFSLGAGCFVLFLHPYDFLFKQKVILQDGGEIFQMWAKPEVQLFCRVYLFNVTNAAEYLSGKADKIVVEEVGPYVYRESLAHNVTAFNDNGTLSAIPIHPLTWVEELSEGHKEDDIVYMPHIALLCFPISCQEVMLKHSYLTYSEPTITGFALFITVGSSVLIFMANVLNMSIANVVSKQSIFTRFGLNNLVTLTNTQPLTKMTAREFMMGHKSELMTLGNTMMPGWIYFDKLGLIDRMYDFTGDYETIFTGESDVRKAGLIDTYRGSTDLPQWKGQHCSNVQNASDGTKFMGGVREDEEILFFRKSLCRAAPLIPTGKGVRNGLNAYLYTFPDHMLDNGKYLEENKCFCRNGHCLPDGLIDVSECYYGFPIALSYPHFYQGDEILFSKVEGITPNKEKHETQFWIEPYSGLPLDVSSKFQINMALGDISMIKNCERFGNMYLPMLWFDIRMYTLPPSMEQRFNLYLNILPVVEQGIMYISFIAGAILTLTTIYILTFKMMFKSIKHNNLWSETCKNNKDVYAPCEIPLDSEFEDDCITKEKMNFGDKMRDLSMKLTDKVYDTVDSVKDIVKENARNIFDRHSDVVIESDGSKSDSGGEHEENFDYKEVKQSDSDDECKYLEVIDDGMDLDFSFDNDRTKLKRDVVLHIAE